MKDLSCAVDSPYHQEPMAMSERSSKTSTTLEGITVSCHAKVEKKSLRRIFCLIVSLEMIRTFLSIKARNDIT